MLKQWAYESQEKNPKGERLSAAYQSPPREDGTQNAVTIAIGGVEVVITPNQASEFARIWKAMREALE